MMFTNIEQIEQNLLEIQDLEYELEQRTRALFEETGLTDFLAKDEAPEVAASGFNPMALMGQVQKLTQYLQYLPEVRGIVSLAARYASLLSKTNKLLAVEVINSATVALPNE